MIFEYDKKSGKISAILDAHHSSQFYECTPTVCSNPVCDCNDVFLKLERSGETHNVGINIKERRLIERKNVSTIDEFSNQLFGLLDESDFKILKDIYWTHKRSGSETADYSQLKVKFPKEDIEQGGIMIIYNDVLPYANRFGITIEGTHYFLDDNYCVKNKCQCTETILCFFPLTNEDSNEYSEVDHIEMAFSIRVDYQLKKWTIDDMSTADYIDASQVRIALESGYTKFYSLLRQRHQQMKLLYSNFLKTLHPERILKVGRNEPCSCGSGKKYKKCCGAGGALLA